MVVSNMIEGPASSRWEKFIGEVEGKKIPLMQNPWRLPRVGLQEIF